MTEAVRSAGAVPAWVGVVGGEVVVGLTAEELNVFSEPGRADKVARRDLPAVCARRPRRDHGVRDDLGRRARRGPRGRDGWDRRRPSGRAARRERRSPRARADARSPGLQRAEVDRGPGRDRRAARGAGREPRRLRGGPAPVLPRTGGRRRPGASRGHARRCRGGRVRRPATRHWVDDRLVQPGAGGRGPRRRHGRGCGPGRGGADRRGTGRGDAIGRRRCWRRSPRPRTAGPSARTSRYSSRTPCWPARWRPPLRGTTGAGEPSSGSTLGSGDARREAPRTPSHPRSPTPSATRTPPPRPSGNPSRPATNPPGTASRARSPGRGRPPRSREARQRDRPPEPDHREGEEGRHRQPDQLAVLARRGRSRGECRPGFGPARSPRRARAGCHRGEAGRCTRRGRPRSRRGFCLSRSWKRARSPKKFRARP